MSTYDSELFINLTNHPSDKWSDEQRKAALAYGMILDFPFPVVDANADEKDIELQAQALVDKIAAYKPAAVCCQGEMTLTFAVVSRLKEMGIPVVAATSTRETVEEIASDGTTRKSVAFRFCRFRSY